MFSLLKTVNFCFISQLTWQFYGSYVINIIVDYTCMCFILQVRTEYLSLIHLILRNSAYGEHTYRASELQRCFSMIGKEEEPDSEMDRLIVKQIYTEFSQHFASIWWQITIIIKCFHKKSMESSMQKLH